MSRIYFRQFYTYTVEYYLRAVIRKCSKDIPKEWYKFTTHWIIRLSDEDREFIEFVFHPNYFNSYVGVSCYPNNDFLLNYKKLYELERQYAIDAGLIDIEVSVNIESEV